MRLSFARRPSASLKHLRRQGREGRSAVVEKGEPCPLSGWKEASPARQPTLATRPPQRQRLCRTHAATYSIDAQCKCRLLCATPQNDRHVMPRFVLWTRFPASLVAARMCGALDGEHSTNYGDRERLSSSIRLSRIAMGGSGRNAHCRRSIGLVVCSGV